jgi:hypothetical protein
VTDSTHNGHSGGNGQVNGQTNGQTNGHVPHGVRFEGTDVDTGSLYFFGSLLALIVVVAVLSMWFLYRYLNNEIHEQQAREMSELIKQATKDKNPGDRLPNDNGKKGPMLEGIKALDPKSPRSGVYGGVSEKDPGYTSLALDARKDMTKHLETYGYHPHDPTMGYIPIEQAIEMVLADPKALPVRDKGPNTPLGSIHNPYSFYPSESSSGRKATGTTRETKP